MNRIQTITKVRLYYVGAALCVGLFNDTCPVGYFDMGYFPGDVKEAEAENNRNNILTDLENNGDRTIIISHWHDDHINLLLAMGLTDYKAFYENASIYAQEPVPPYNKSGKGISPAAVTILRRFVRAKQGNSPSVTSDVHLFQNKGSTATGQDIIDSASYTEETINLGRRTPTRDDKKEAVGTIYPTLESSPPPPTIIKDKYIGKVNLYSISSTPKATNHPHHHGVYLIIPLCDSLNVVKKVVLLVGDCTYAGLPNFVSAFANIKQEDVYLQASHHGGDYYVGVKNKPKREASIPTLFASPGNGTVIYSTNGKRHNHPDRQVLADHENKGWTKPIRADGMKSTGGQDGRFYEITATGGKVY